MKVDLTFYVYFSRLAKRLQERLWGEAGPEGKGERSHGQEWAEDSHPSNDIKRKEKEKEREDKEEEKVEEGKMEKGGEEEEEEDHDTKVIKTAISNAASRPQI